MITGERMAAVDANAAGCGVPQRQLMESSGNAVARTVRDVADPGDRIAIVAGRGNNGGDAFVAARFLDDAGAAEGFEVTTYLLGRAESIGTEIARANWDALVAGEYDAREVVDSSDVELVVGDPAAGGGDGDGPGADGTGDPDVIVDAMLGTGISGELREPAATAAREIDEADATVVSVDVPSGFDANAGVHADNGVTADVVVTFHDTKPGLDELATREGFDLRVADIGIPAAAERFVGPGDLGLARPPARTGRAFVVGGGPYTGAPALAAQAALRAGMELSFVAAPEAVAGEIQSYAEDLIVQPYDGEVLTPDQVPNLVDVAERHDDVVVLGPGLGRADETLEAARRFLESYTGPAVVDAEALEVVPDVETEATLVCTPNRGELARMGGPEADDLRDVTDEIEALAADLGHVVLVKGVDDVITDGERTRLARVGTPGMAVGGTGDTLAGIVAGLLEHADPFDAACVGAYVNGMAGEGLAERIGDGPEGLGTLASELLDEIPRVLWNDG